MDEIQTDNANNTRPNPAEPQGRWCLVANVTKEYANAARPPGSRHLPEGAKVYVNGMFCGDGWESAEVLCKDRRSQKWFKMYFRTHWLHNFRAIVEYSPSMQKRLDEANFLGGSDDEAAERCHGYMNQGNRQAADFAVGRITRRHAPLVKENAK